MTETEKCPRHGGPTRAGQISTPGFQIELHDSPWQHRRPALFFEPESAVPKNSFREQAQTDRLHQPTLLKLFPFFFSEIDVLSIDPASMRGAYRDRHETRGWDAVGVSMLPAWSLHVDEQHDAHGQVVWSWHPGADAPRNAFTHCRGCDDAKQRR
jgi:hypothetical protein